MKEEIYISEKKIHSLASKISKTFCLSKGEALEIIYEEWDLVENLFYTYVKVSEVHYYLCEEINYTYRIA